MGPNARARTPPAPLPKRKKLGSLGRNKNIFALEEQSDVGEGKHFQRRLIKLIKRRRRWRRGEASERPPGATLLPHLLPTMAEGGWGGATAFERMERSLIQIKASEWESFNGFGPGY